METSRFKRTRRLILIRALMAPFIIVMLVCGILVYYFAVNLRGQVASELVRIADGHHRLVDQFLSERSSDIEFAAASNGFEALSRSERLTEVLSLLQARSPAFLDLGVFDERGNHVAYVGPYNLEGKNYAQAEWFRAVQDKSVYVSDVFLGYRNTPHFIRSS